MLYEIRRPLPLRELGFDSNLDGFREYDLPTNYSLIENFLKKRDLQKRGDISHEDIKTAVIFGGGGLKVAFGGGVAHGLAELSIIPSFVYGISGGALIAAHYVDGGINQGIEVLTNQLPSSEVVKAQWGRPIVDTGLLMNLFRDKAPFDNEKIYNSPSDLFICTTDADTGEAAYWDMKNSELPFEDIMRASMAAPIANNELIQIGDSKHIDGCLSGLPIDHAVQNGATDILIVMSSNLDEVTGPIPQYQQAIANLALRHYPPRAREAFMLRNARYKAALAKAISDEHAGVNVGFIGPAKNPLSFFTTNRRKLTQLVDKGSEVAYRFFSPASATSTTKTAST